MNKAKMSLRIMSSDIGDTDIGVPYLWVQTATASADVGSTKYRYLVNQILMVPR